MRRKRRMMMRRRQERRRRRSIFHSKNSHSFLTLFTTISIHL
jgi:hypothetical protein